MSAPEWRNKLLRNQYGSPKACLQNALLALDQPPEWHGVLHFNESTLQVEAKAAPP